MENAENGASQLTLSTDVNENTETGFSLSGLTIDASERGVSGDKGLHKICFEGKRDSDEKKAEYATDRGAGGLYTGDECVGTGSTMLGFIAKGTSSGAKNNCVTSDRHTDSSLNRVTESARQSMVESSAGGRGTSAGNPPGVADVADCQPDTDEVHPRDFAGTVGQPKCSTERNMQKDTSNSNQELHSTPHLSSSCDGHEHQQICRCQASQPEPLTLRNGNMNDTGQLSAVSESGSESKWQPVEKVGNVKMANGEVMSAENMEGLKAAIQPTVTEACVSNPLVENPLPHSVPQSSRTECRALETRVVEPPENDRDVFDDSYISPSRQIHRDETVPRVELSSGPDTETSVTARPQSLKSITHSTHFLSCDSTPLSPERSNAFLCPGAERDLNFMDVNLNSRNTFEISRRQSAPDNMPGVMTVASASMSSDQLSKQKKHGITEFFGRGLFSKKQCEQQSAPGWKLFGKVPPRENNPKDSRTIQQEYEAKRAQSGHSPPPQAAHSGAGRRKNLEFEPLSTTALILEDRPANLPAKSSEEAQRHRQEYDEMVAEAKKRELKEAQRKKKMMKERFKQEESIASAMVAWNNEILPNWESM